MQVAGDISSFWVLYLHYCFLDEKRSGFESFCSQRRGKKTIKIFAIIEATWWNTGYMKDEYRSVSYPAARARTHVPRDDARIRTTRAPARRRRVDLYN